MQLTEVLMLPPAVCFICRNGIAGEPLPFVDTLRHHQLGNALDRIYCCGNCAKQMADLYGFADPQERAELERQIEEQDAELERREAEVNELHTQLEATDVIKALMPTTMKTLDVIAKAKVN
jgi:hypothetical protein